MSLKKILTSGDYTTSRIETFSDGVFAIVVTLLILNIHTPAIDHVTNHNLLTALLSLKTKMFVYLIGFLNIAVYWINHHQLFSVLKKTDRGFLWLNTLLLIILAFIPFPTSIIGEYANQFVAVAFFGGTMILAAICFGTMRAYSFYYGCLVDCRRINKRSIKLAMIKSYSGALFYLAAILLGLISTKISVALFFFIPLIYSLPGRLDLKPIA